MTLHREVRNADLIKAILISPCTRPALTTFKWVKGHKNDYEDTRAHTLVKEGRGSDAILILDNKKG